MKIKHQLLVTHGLLVLLSVIIVFLNIAAYRVIRNDATIINQSGRLRALSYHMSQITNRINNPENGGSITELYEDLKLRVMELWNAKVLKNLMLIL